MMWFGGTVEKWKGEKVKLTVKTVMLLLASRLFSFPLC